jgi:hypothetical protein
MIACQRFALEMLDATHMISRTALPVIVMTKAKMSM